MLIMTCAWLGVLVAFVSNAQWRAGLKKNANAPRTYTVDGVKLDAPLGPFITILVMDVVSV